jgi:hypothetical protein
LATSDPVSSIEVLNRAGAIVGVGVLVGVGGTVVAGTLVAGAVVGVGVGVGCSAGVVVGIGVTLVLPTPPDGVPPSFSLPQATNPQPIRTTPAMAATRRTPRPYMLQPLPLDVPRWTHIMAK